MKSNNLRVLLAMVFLFSTGIFAGCKKKEKDPLPQTPDSEEATAKVSAASCTHTIALSESNVDGSNFAPGSVICLEGGTRRALLLRNFKGTADKPIIFINKGKVVFKLTSSNAYGLRVDNSSFFRITGTGGDAERGIEIDGSHLGLSIGALSTNCEVDHLEIHNIGFAGIMAKTDPSCDQATWRQNFTMRDVRIHDNYIYDTQGEGIYIGNSFYVKGRDLPCGSILPHAIHGCRVYDNTLRNTGWEAIQVGCVTQDAEIFNNDIENYGFRNISAQNNGIQIGEGTSSKCYNNIVNKGKGNGIIVLTDRNNYVYNNLIINAEGRGVFCDSRGTTQGSEFAFINNTLINPGIGGIWQYSSTTKNTIYNNLITGMKADVVLRNGAAADQKNNLIIATVAEAQFVNPGSGNYQLKAGSPAIDAGKNVASYGITFDLAGNARPAGAGFDVGAYEFGSTGGSTGGGSTVPATPVVPTEVNGIVVTSSSYQSPNSPVNTLDNNLNTRWSADGKGQWIKYDLKSYKNVNSLEIAFFNGSDRKSFFDIEVSKDNQSWIKVYTGSCSGTSNELEKFDFSDAEARYVRIVGQGNTFNSWNSYTNVKINTGSAASPAPAPGGELVGNIRVTASSFQEPNRPANTLDNQMSTRWSAQGIQWIQYELAQSATISSIDIAWMSGNQRVTSFDISVSGNGSTWNKVFTGKNSGATANFENYAFTPVSAKFVRITGYGNSFNDWNSISQTRINTGIASTAPPASTAPAPAPTVPIPSMPAQKRTFTTVSDAYLDRNNRSVNNNTLQIGPGSNTIYVKYNVSDIDATRMTGAKIQLQVINGFSGGTVRVAKGSHNNWTETNLTLNNRPVAVQQVFSSTRNFDKGSIYEFDVTSAIKGNGTYTFMLTLDTGGKHVTFSSKEGAWAPKLVVE
ncbi:MAG: discoidin domain-containing protein [Cytophagaceae bacterium]